MRWHRLLSGRTYDNSALGEITARSLFAVPQRRAYLGGWRAAPDGGGDLVNDLAIHHLDLLIYLLGSRFDSAFASYSTSSQFVESAAIHLNLENGISADLQLVSGAAAENRLELHGSRGSLLVDFYRFDGIEFVPSDRPPGSLKSRFFRSLQITCCCRTMGVSARRRFSCRIATWQDLWIGAGRSVVSTCRRRHAIQPPQQRFESVRTGKTVTGAPIGHTAVNPSANAAKSACLPVSLRSW
jgi:hypothetical protein